MRKITTQLQVETILDRNADENKFKNAVKYVKCHSVANFDACGLRPVGQSKKIFVLLHPETSFYLLEVPVPEYQDDSHWSCPKYIYTVLTD